MKIYLVMDNDYQSTRYNPIYSAHLSKEKAKQLSEELRQKAFLSDIEHYVHNEEMSREEATEEAIKYFPVWLYNVKELEVQE